VKWTSVSPYAETGLPRAMSDLGAYLDEGVGLAAPDYPAAAGWYRRAADAGVGQAAENLCNMYTLGRGGAPHVILRILDPGSLW
jgi:TPR repeat protein